MRAHSTTTNRSTVSFGTDARKRSLLDVHVDTTIVYNDGERGRSRIFDNLRIKPGH